jgi:uridine monophosphate synthetase
MILLDKLNTAIEQNQSLLYLGLDPNPECLPVHYGQPENQIDLIDCLQDWLRSLISQTTDLVCAYKPTLGFYTALGSAGLELLQETLAAIPQHIPIILDATHADLNSSSLFAETIFEKWQVDAVTVSPYPGQDLVAPFLLYADKAVFILCHTSNQAAVGIQEYPTSQSPLYLQVVKEAQTWGTPEQVGLRSGSREPRGVSPNPSDRSRTVNPRSQYLD